jgi:hypothetical protein
MREIRTSGSMRGEWGALSGAVFPSPLLYSPSIELRINFTKQSPSAEGKSPPRPPSSY